MMKKMMSHVLRHPIECKLKFEQKKWSFGPTVLTMCVKYGIKLEKLLIVIIYFRTKYFMSVCIALAKCIL